jgi:hypothetical protein
LQSRANLDLPFLGSTALFTLILAALAPKKPGCQQPRTWIRALRAHPFSSMLSATDQWGLSNLAHVFVVQVNQIAKCATVPHHAWLGRSIAIDVAFHFERPFFAPKK